jgi:hypothetical protein
VTLIAHDRADPSSQWASSNGHVVPPLDGDQSWMAPNQIAIMVAIANGFA